MQSPSSPQQESDKTIPSKVFANHFSAIEYKIKNSPNKHKLKLLKYYNEIKLINGSVKMNTLQKFLGSSWSTEYTLRMASQVDDSEYYKFSIYWSFPQAYYSTYLAMTAFHETQGMASQQHEKSIKRFGNSIKGGHYPTAINFF